MKDTAKTFETRRPEGLPGLGRILTALVLFGVSFGCVEAVLVVYLRALYEPVHQRTYPAAAPDDLFPMIRLERLELGAEVIREAATMVMLGAVGLAVARNVRQGLAAFMIAFGIWDIVYYVFLRWLIGWPRSLLTWDLLFLLPVPWVGPVLAPVLVAISLIGAGVVVLRREAAGRPLRVAPMDWGAAALGGLIVVLAFCWDYRNIMAAGMPRPFPWSLFALGEGLGIAGFAHLLWINRDCAERPRARRTASAWLEPGRS